MYGDWSRRRFLQLSAASAAALALGACSSDDGGSSADRSTTSATRRSGTLKDIDHVVIMFQENRSFDQIFGTRKDVRGFGDPDVGVGEDGRPIWYQKTDAHPDGYVLPFAMTAKGIGGQCGFDVDHSWEGQHTAWNKGAMDGFARQMGPLAMGYFRRQDLPWYYALADEFTVCDSWFCSVLGPTNPNRYYSMTGTIDPANTGGGPAIDNSGKHYTWETYPERLQKAGISWQVYQQDDDYGDNCIENFRQFQGLPKSDPLWRRGVRTTEVRDFVADAKAGNLPQVSWIVAPERQSEHPVWAPADGQAYVARHVQAIMDNPKLWAKTVFILSYDENGGFFDHVPPPVPDPGTRDEFVKGQPIGLGARVPGLILSPWSRGGHVNSDVFDHTSTLRFLEERFGVEAPLISAWRRETCGDLTSTLSMDRFDPSIPKLASPAKLAADVTDACTEGPRPEPPKPQGLPAVEA